jgi:lysophospholipase L1-like esterase
VKKALKLFLIYILPVILIISSFEYNLSKVKNSYNKKKSFLEESIVEYKVLVLGSSHALSGIDPSFFAKKAFNLANVSQSLYYDFQLFSKYLQETGNLKIVLISLDYFTLEYNLSRCPEYWRTFFYERVYGIPTESKEHQFDISRFSLIRLYAGENSLKYALKLFKVDLAETMRKNGFYHNFSYAKDLIKNGKERMDYHRKIMMETNIRANMEYLAKIIELSVANNVIPVIITLPVFHTYSDNIDVTKYQLMQENIDKLCKRYKIQYYNYFYDGRFKVDDFGDSDHLNLKGAEKVSKIINFEILNQGE